VFFAGTGVVQASDILPIAGINALGDAASTLWRSWFAKAFHIATINVMAKAANTVWISFRSRVFCFSGMAFSSSQCEISVAL
jgi:hypothetical protein